MPDPRHAARPGPSAGPRPAFPVPRGLAPIGVSLREIRESIAFERERKEARDARLR